MRNGILKPLKSTAFNQSKQRKCRVCKDKFTPTRPLQPTCRKYECQVTYAESQAGKRIKARERTERDEISARKAKLKTPGQLAEECRRIVQKIARIRDRNDGCISCNLPASWGGQWHGSHFRAANTASAVELHLLNIHKACSVCNKHKGGNIINYRPRLIAKIGQEKVDWLMSQNQVVKRNREYYARFKVVMGKWLRRIEKRI